jgi:hypothetical protein
LEKFGYVQPNLHQPSVHRTVRLHKLVQQRTRCSRESARAPWLKITGLSGGAPDCPVSQQRPRQQSAARSAADACPETTVTRSHRIVRCAPDSVRCAKGTKGSTVGFATKGRKSGTVHVSWCTGLSGVSTGIRRELPTKWSSNSS